MKNSFKPTPYKLKTYLTSRIDFDHSSWTLDDAQCSSPSLIRAIYEDKQLTVGDPQRGIYKFAQWLPISRTLEGSSAPSTYKSEALAKHLGLENLYITISGYAPEKGVNMPTCSFKETEAYTVCGRLDAANEKILVVASAGNTARAFAHVCSNNNIPLLLFVPKDNLNALWSEKPLNPCVKLVVSEAGSDYFDAIHLSNIAVKDERFLAEGGAKNVARRDGMSTTMLSAVTTIGQIPDYYFQAIGSGTGAVAAWEANLRFLEDGRFGTNKAKMILSQNAPFSPMYDAWKADSRELFPLEDKTAREQVEQIHAKVLSNRKPPYSIAGGVYDALKDCDGDMMLVHNAQAQAAGQLFKDLEGVDIHPAASVAVASLIEAVEKGMVERDKIVMINITGAGEERFQSEREGTLHYLEPSLEFGVDAKEEDVLGAVAKLFFAN